MCSYAMRIVRHIISHTHTRYRAGARQTLQVAVRSDRILDMSTTKRESLWWGWHLGALLMHLGLSVLFTWPLVLNFLPGSGTTVPGFMREDRDQNLWNLWWTGQAVLGGHNPFVTDMIWYPTPISLYYHTLNVFNGLLAIPLMTVFSLQTTYNIVILFSFVTCGWGAYLLFHYLCGNKWAAFVGSVVFAYSAYHVATMRSLLQLVSLEWVPFFLLFFLKAVFAIPSNTWRDWFNWAWRRALPAALFLLLVSLVDWYYTMYSLMLAGLVLLYLLLRSIVQQVRRKPNENQATEGSPPVVGRVWLRGVGEPWLRGAVVVASYLIIVSPILIPMLRELRTTDSMLPTADAALMHSADLLTFFEPMRGHKLWGQFFLNRDYWPFGADRYEVYFTYTALFLAGVALFATRKLRPRLQSQTSNNSEISAAITTGDLPGADSPAHTAEISTASPRAVALPSKWFWGACTLLFFLLALGPVLQVNGAQINLPFPMPYNLVGDLPVLNISRSPDRFDMPLTLCLGVLAGFGTSVLLSRWLPRLHLERRGALLCAGTLGFILLELAPIPYPQLKADVPAWFYELGKEQGDFSILELPPQDDFWHGAYRMYFQTVHGKHIFGGYISREYPHPFLESTPGYQELTYLDGHGDMFESGPDQWYSAFQQYNTKYIVLYKSRAPHRIDPPVDVTPSRDAIKMVLGADATPFYEDDELEVYNVPAPQNTVPYLSVGADWQPREIGPNGTFRWMGDKATFRIDSPRQMDAYLTFQASGLGPPRRLQIFHGDQLVVDQVVSGLQTFTTSGPLGLPQGVSTLTFVSPDGTSSPAELGLNTDPRRLSFAILNAKLVPVEK